MRNPVNWFSSRIVWHSRLLLVDWWRLQTIYFRLDLFSLGFARVILFSVGISCWVPAFSCYYVSIILDQSWLLISLLAVFDYFWSWFLSDFWLSWLVLFAHYVLCVCALFAISCFRILCSLWFFWSRFIAIFIHCYLGAACFIFAKCWFWFWAFLDPLILFFWDLSSAIGVWRLPNVHTVNCRWSSPHCACYAVSVCVSLLWLRVMIQFHSLLMIGCGVITEAFFGKCHCSCFDRLRAMLYWCSAHCSADSFALRY